MAVPVPLGRPSTLRLACALLAFAALAVALPTNAPPHSGAPFSPRSVIINHLPDNTTVVINTDTDQDISQGDATDGGGQGFNIPAILWIVFSFLIGLPMATVGIRGWRMTSGVGVGLALAVAAWAAFINAVSSANLAQFDSTSDLILTLIVFGTFVLGFIIGFVKWGILIGISILSLVGGVAIGVRVVLLREGLLFGTGDLYAVNWVVVGVCAAAGGLIMIWRHRWAILVSSTSVGTFLSLLGLDLVINKQSGMSIGLRVLFDRNDAHVLALESGYNPPISAIIINIVSLVLIPILAYAQHRFFPTEWARKTASTVFDTLPGNPTTYSPEKPIPSFAPSTTVVRQGTQHRDTQQMAELPPSLRPGTPSQRSQGRPQRSQSRGGSDERVPPMPAMDVAWVERGAPKIVTAAATAPPPRAAPPDAVADAPRPRNDAMLFAPDSPV